jgi:hypothetical protein
MTILRANAGPAHHEGSVFRVGVRGSVAMRRLTNPVTLRDYRGIFFVGAGGQIQMAACADCPLAS